MFPRYFFRVLLLMWLAATADMAQAATRTVTSLDDTGAGTLRSAIGQAASGDTIDFQAGLSGTIFLDSPLPALAGSLTIQGPGADVITVSGRGQYRVFFIELDAMVTIAGLTIADGFTDAPLTSPDETDGFGGGIFNLGNLTLEDSVLQNNFAEIGGGGLSNAEGIVNVLGTTVTDNSTDSSGVGGGIDTFGGRVDVVESTVSGNQAEIGGGTFNDAGEMRLAASTVSANVADLGAGISNLGTLALVNSTISGNGAVDAGGGIENFGGDVTLLFSTIADNTAASGGGVLNDGGGFTAKNSLVADSPTGGDCAGIATSFNVAGDNFDTDGTCPEFFEVTSAALALEPLAVNGGPTETHGLGETSTAVDAAADCTDIGGTASIDDDQRGVARPQGSSCDTGALEFSGLAEVIFADGFEGS